MKKLFKTCLIIVGLILTTCIINLHVHASDTEHTHIYDNGICECGEYQKPDWDQGVHSGWVVRNAGELLWYRDGFNKGEVISSLKIAGNIVLPQNIEWTPIGTEEHPFNKRILTYGDQSFTIDLGTQDVKTSNYGLIGYTTSNSDEITDISNIIVLGTFNITSTIDAVAGIVGHATGNTKIKNVTNAVSIILKESGIGSTKIGGIVGKGEDTTIIEKSSNIGSLKLDGVYDSVGGIAGTLEQGQIVDSVNYANVESNTAKYIGGILGHVNSSSFEGITNCLNIGNVSGITFDVSINNENITLKPADICGYLEKTIKERLTNNYYKGEDAVGNLDNLDGVYKVSDEELASGKITYLLGDSFGQSLDDSSEKEIYPTIASTKVFQVYECDGKTLKYSNFNQNVEHQHTYKVLENKIIQVCDVCGEERYLKLFIPDDLYYDKTIKELVIETDFEDIDESEVEITYSAEVMFPGNYTATMTYKGLTVTYDFEVKKGLPKISMFNKIDVPELTYDGNPKYLELYETDEPGMGKIVVAYRGQNGDCSNPVDAGLYSVILSVEEGKYYQAYEFSVLDNLYMFEIKPKEITINWTKTTLFYELDKTVYTPECYLKGTVYNENVTLQFSNIGTKPGTYTTTVSSVNPNYVLVGDNLTTEFVVKPILVPLPEIENFIHDGREKYIPDVQDTDLYRVIQNNGGTGFGLYPVILELIDDELYTWETTDDKTITTFFYVYLSETNWLEYPSIESWAYGDTPNLPKYKVNNDYLNITYKYRLAGGEFLSEAPTEVGEYEVVFISEKNDARAAPLEDVIVKFSITKAEPVCGIDSILYADYGTLLKDIELVGFGEGTWSYVGDSDVLLNAGTHQVDVKFTPKYAKNYSEVTKTISIVINKLETEYEEPTKIDNLVYNGEYQLVVNAGSVVYGTMYYSVNGSEWSASIPLLKDAGTYTISYKIEGDINHKDVLEESIVVTIEKKELLIKVDNIEIEQYLDMPEFTYKVGGIVKGDELIVEPTIKVDIQDTSVVGTYELKAQDASINNYNISYETGTLKINAHTKCIGGTATCEKPAQCSICNKEYGETLAHNFDVYLPDGNKTCTTLGTETAKCTLCGKLDTKDVTEGNLLDHSFKTYTSNNDSTCQNDLTMSSKCEHCDAINTVTVPNTKTNHIDSNQDNLCDVCNTINQVAPPKQSSKLGLGIVIGSAPLIIAGVIVYFTVIKRKIKKAK